MAFNRNSNNNNDNNNNNNNNSGSLFDLNQITNNKDSYQCSISSCDNFIDIDSISFMPCGHQICSSCLSLEAHDPINIPNCPACDKIINHSTRFTEQEAMEAQQHKKKQQQRYRRCFLNEHNQDYEYFCTDCNEILCFTCLQAHSQHNIKECKEGLDQSEKDSLLQSFSTTQIDPLIKSFEKRIHTLKINANKYDAFHKESLRNLMENAIKYSKEISILAASRKGQLDQMGEEKIKSVKDRIEALNSFRNFIESHRPLFNKIENDQLLLDEFDQMEINSIEDQQEKETMKKTILNRDFNAMAKFTQTLNKLKQDLANDDQQLEQLLSTLKFGLKAVDQADFQWLIKMYICTCQDHYKINCNCVSKIYNSNSAKPSSNNEQVDIDKSDPSSSSASSSSKTTYYASDQIFPMDDTISKRSPLKLIIKIGGKIPNIDGSYTGCAMYDVDTRQWEQIESLSSPQGILSNSCCFFNNFIYLFTSKSSLSYGLENKMGKWENISMANYGGDGVSVVTNKSTDCIYLIGGEKSPQNIISFNPSKRNHLVFDLLLNPPRTNCFSISIKDKIYIIGGISQSNTTTTTTTTTMVVSSKNTIAPAETKANKKTISVPLTLIEEFNLTEKTLTTYTNLKVTGIIQGACYNGDDLIFIITSREFLSFSIKSKETFTLNFPPLSFFMGVSLVYGFVGSPNNECVFLIGVGGIYYFDLLVLKWFTYDTVSKDELKDSKYSKALDPNYQTYFHACIPIYQSELFS
ncbi:hypothetical protein CYY_009778 [Polysphondylium violaceum]|uniref:Kelch repeat-containing protein n=1 Tax=Polysphondylium violaceum TaxID=133409 RepID=A0A8J4PL76_9MYCE|nr:hypothetical protein CYY_009778 [Polysphondylium violaceum]